MRGVGKEFVPNVPKADIALKDGIFPTADISTKVVFASHDPAIDPNPVEVAVTHDDDQGPPRDLLPR
jgi:hypothetical protein